MTKTTYAFIGTGILVLASVVVILARDSFSPEAQFSGNQENSAPFYVNVDANKRINYDIGTTTYTTAWYGAVNTWNTYGNSVGGVTIATSTGTSTLILKLEDLPSDPSSAVVGQYLPLEQKLVFNPYYMQNYTLQFQQNVTTHELGHALGLWHSYLGNMMNSYVTGTTTLEIQDKLDYDYCWAGSNSVCRQ